MDRSAFFAAARSKPFGAALSQSQVDGCNALLDATEGLPLQQRAYVLATARHECAGTMQPIIERGARSYFDKYEPGTAIGKTLGNVHPGDGYLYRGRGYVQLTGRLNYARASKEVGADLIANPDLALQPAIAANIIVRGMTEGWFTGRKLSDYILGSKADYQNARRIVNGLDRAGLIAGYAVDFEDALRAAGVVAPAPPAPPPIAPVPPVAVSPLPPAIRPAHVGIAAVIILLASAIAAGWHHLVSFFH